MAAPGRAPRQARQGHGSSGHGLVQAPTRCARAGDADETVGPDQGPRKGHDLGVEVARGLRQRQPASVSTMGSRGDLAGRGGAALDPILLRIGLTAPSYGLTGERGETDWEEDRSAYRL